MNLAVFIPIFALVISVNSQNTNNDLCGEVRCQSDECCSGVIIKRCLKLGSAGSACGALTCPCQSGLYCFSEQGQFGVCKPDLSIQGPLPLIPNSGYPGSLVDVADDVPIPRVPGLKILVKRQTDGGAGGLIGGILGNLPFPKSSNGSSGGIPIPGIPGGLKLPIPGASGSGGIKIPGLTGGLPIPGLSGGLPIPGLSGGLPIPGLSGLFGGAPTNTPYQPGSIIFPGLPPIPIPGMPGTLNLPLLMQSLPIPGISNSINIPQLLRSLPIPGIIVPFPGRPGGIAIPGLGASGAGSGGLSSLLGGLPIPGLGGGLPIPGLGGGLMGGLPIPGLG